MGGRFMVGPPLEPGGLPRQNALTRQIVGRSPFWLSTRLAPVGELLALPMASPRGPLDDMPDSAIEKRAAARRGEVLERSPVAEAPDEGPSEDDLDRFNRTWGTDYPTWERLTAVGRWDKLLQPETQPDELAALNDGFVCRVAAQYFRVCHEAIRQHDPNHLIMGCRFAGYAPRPVIESMGDYVDVVSYNNYDVLPPEDRLCEIHEWTGKPVLLTEFSFKAQDSGLPNTHGAGEPVATQQDRADHYARYVKALVKLPYMVGFHWFKYADQPAEGRFDGENSNYGLVRLDDTAYTELTERMQAVNPTLDTMHTAANRPG